MYVINPTHRKPETIKKHLLNVQILFFNNSYIKEEKKNSTYLVLQFPVSFTHHLILTTVSTMYSMCIEYICYVYYVLLQIMYTPVSIGLAKNCIRIFLHCLTEKSRWTFCLIQYYVYYPYFRDEYTVILKS